VSEPYVERRLAAILVADVVGYSRLVEENEAGTLSALRQQRTDVLDPLIAQHHGRVFKVMGDGVIAEFTSVVDAVACAVAVQKSLAQSESGEKSACAIALRMGINLGDVVVDGGDLLGDGVNVAARLEQLCDPGGILVSGTVYDHLQGKLDLTLENRGEQRVKNIARPIRVYAVQINKSGNKRARQWSSLPTRWLAVVGLAVPLLVSGAVWIVLQKNDGRGSTERSALALPDKPSIAVLPFDNLSGDPGQSYFVDGMTEDLITDLSKLSGLFVIARNSSWSYKGKAVKVQDVARDLGVRYVLEGSAQRQGPSVRINAQLIDAVDGHHLWAERYDGELDDVFSLQDKVIRQIVDALAVKLTPGEVARTGQFETSNPAAYDALLQGWDHLRRDQQDETLKAIASFQQAVSLDPGYSRAYAALAAANLRIVVSLWEAASGAEFENAMERTKVNLTRALEKPTSLAYAVSAEMLGRQGQYAEAFAAIDKALALAPNDPENFVSKANILNASGRAGEAELAARTAMRFDPGFAPATLRVLAQSLFLQRRYEDAVATLKQVVSKQSDVAADYMTLVSALGYLGRASETRDYVEKYNALAADGGFDTLTVQEAGWWWYDDTFNFDASYRPLMQEGLRKANIPEGAGTDIPYFDYKRLISTKNGEFEVAGAAQVDVNEAKKLHDRGVVFIDVRAPGDFAKGHIPGARNLSLPTYLSRESLAERVTADQEVVFHCLGKYCPYSAYATAKALVWGYTHVYRFSGGFPAWQNAGLATEESKTAGK
jgi:adenylate cyclase